MHITRPEAETLASKLAASLDLDAQIHQFNKIHWQNICGAVDYLPAAYTQANFEYQCEYARANSDSVHDISLVFLRDNAPIGLWPICISSKSDQHQLSSAGAAVMPPIFARQISPKAQKKIVSSCYEFAQRLCQTLDIPTWESHESFTNSSEGLSAWHQNGMAIGAIPSMRHDLYADLSMGINAYKSKLRKSYKSLISSGAALWRVGIMCERDDTIWAQFRALHLREAGRITRPDITWDLQYDALMAGSAMLVHLHDQQNQMVGAGYFSFSKDEASYDVAAYARALFDKPIGHVVQFCAVEEMMRRNLKWYKLGLKPYLGTIPNATDKENSIAHFKQGFSTHTMPRLVLTHRQK